MGKAVGAWKTNRVYVRLRRFDLQGMGYIMLEVAVVIAVTLTVMALLYRWLEPKT
jgi:uncharacterized BrkB/YihY/UPF0761 family membrane protein